MEQSIRTLIPVYGCGTQVFSGHRNLITAPFDEGSFNSLLLLLSDRVLLDESWRIPFEEFGGVEACATGVAIERLIASGIVEEIRVTRDLLGPEQEIVLRAALDGVVQFGKEHDLLDPSFDLDLGPDVHATIEQWLEPKRSPPGLPSDLLALVLDFVLTYCLVGKVCTRLHDPRGYVRAGSAFVNQSFSRGKSRPPRPAPQGERLIDCVLALCSGELPDVPIWLSAGGQATTPDQPFDTLPFLEREGQPKPDSDATLRRVDALLKIRDTPLCRDTRTLYRQLLTSYPDLETLLVTREQFQRQWQVARSELRRELRFATKMARWTDVLTVPAALASLAIPPAGVLPLITWTISKASERRGRERLEQRSPWFMLAEQLGDLGILARDSLDGQTPSSGDRKRSWVRRLWHR